MLVGVYRLQEQVVPDHHKFRAVPEMWRAGAEEQQGVNWRYGGWRR